MPRGKASKESPLVQVISGQRFDGEVGIVGGLVTTDFGAAATLLRSDEPGAKVAVARITKLSLCMTSDAEEEEARKYFPRESTSMRLY
jgi:hypothetical protein